MKKKILVAIFLLNFNSYSFSNELDCNEFKKFSVNYMKCKASLIKDKTVSAGKNFIDETKSYQNKEWSDEKNKLNDLKEKVTDK
tara:strand:+ start:1552 stop:1803 length:252 start_codon:yes stop_codon:yes gene_type:complete